VIGREGARAWLAVKHDKESSYVRSKFNINGASLKHPAVRCPLSVVIIRACSSQTFRERSPACEPSADAGSDGASPWRGEKLALTW
jgi:hypothetical protein